MDVDLTGGASSRLRTAEDLESVQEIVRTAARRLADADGATFVLRDVDLCFYADEDAMSPLWKGQRFPITNCISGWAMLNAQTAIVPDITKDDRIPIESYRPTFVKSLAMVPIGDDKPVGAIGAYWARPHVAAPAELDALRELARSTAEALDRVGMLDASRPPALVGTAAPVAAPVERNITRPPGTDHERIARDIHDTVIQRLFAAGMRLQRTARTADDPSIAAELDAVGTDLDLAIRDLRGAILGLEYDHGRLDGIRADVLATTAEAARTLGFKPVVTFDGVLEGADLSLRHDVRGVLRELLSNVARHARASRVVVECTGGSSLRLSVTDDGAGFPTHRGSGSGLGNLAARAAARGGSFATSPADGGGTSATWTVPVA